MFGGKIEYNWKILNLNLIKPLVSEKNYETVYYVAGLSALVSVLGLFYKPLKLVAVPLNHMKDIKATSKVKAPNLQNRALSISSIDDQKSLVIKVKKNHLRIKS